MALRWQNLSKRQTKTLSFVWVQCLTKAILWKKEDRYVKGRSCVGWVWTLNVSLSCNLFSAMKCFGHRQNLFDELHKNLFPYYHPVLEPLVTRLSERWQQIMELQILRCALYSSFSVQDGNLWPLILKNRPARQSVKIVSFTNLDIRSVAFHYLREVNRMINQGSTTPPFIRHHNRTYFELWRKIRLISPILPQFFFVRH